MSKIIIIFVCSLICLLIFSFFFFFWPKRETIEISDVKIRTEVVGTAEKMARGLSGRTGLGEKEGMLFVFSEPGIYPFWMKEMNFPLDFVWIDEKRQIVGLNENIAPETYPELFRPAKPVKYVLELNAGFCEKYKVKIGDFVL